MYVCTVLLQCLVGEEECQEWIWGLALSDNILNFGLKKECTNPGRQVDPATVVCTSPVGPYYEIGFVALGIMKWLLDFWKICVLLT